MTGIRHSVRARNPLPPGTVPVAAGLVVNGITTYVFLVLGRRSLGEDDYATLAVLWGLVFILGPGLFQPLEQEVARATASRASAGHGSAPVLRRAGVLGFAQFLLVAVGLLVAWPLGLDRLLDGDGAVLAMLVFALGAVALALLIRGVLGGDHRFADYGRFLSVEGIGRLLLTGVVVAVGVESPGTFGVALAGGFLAATVVAVAAHRPFVRDGPPASWGEITPALGLLLVTSVSEAFLIQVGPVVVRALSDASDDAGVFLNATIVARLPLFLFQAVKASLLPNLARMAALHDHEGFREQLVRLVGFVVALAAAATGLAALVGPFVVELLFDDAVGRRDMALLSAGTGGAMLAMAFALALVAMGRTPLAVAGWVAGVAAFSALLAAGGDVFLRVEIAYVGGMVTAAALMVAFTVVALPGGRYSPMRRL